jgi:hypothetical protein
MPLQQVKLSEIPSDPYGYTVGRFAERLRDQLRMTEGYDLGFDWTRNPKQAKLRQLLQNPPSNRIQHVLLRGSVGSGKSIGAHAWALETLASYAGADWLGMRTTHDEILLTIWKQISDFLTRMKVPYTSGKDPAFIELPNKSGFRFWSARAVVTSTTADVAKGLGSAEFSGATMEEADAIPEEAVNTISQRLRQPSGVPSRVIFYIANPPPMGHWLHKKFNLREVEFPEDYHEFHFTLEDNRANLPPGWIESLYAEYRSKPALFRRMILGEYGPEAKGHPIFAEYFNRDFHVAKSSFIERWREDKLWRDGPVCLCFDFGAEHPALVFFQDADYGRFQQIRLLGGFLGDREILRFFARYCLDKIHELLPNADFLTFCDPAGSQRDGRGVTEENAIDVLKGLGLHPYYRKSGIDYGIDLIAEQLTTTFNIAKVGVQPALVVDPNPLTEDLLDGFEIGYCQNSNRTGKEDKWDPVKDGRYDHLFDAFRYGVIHRRKPNANAPAPRHERTGYSRMVADVSGRLYVPDPFLQNEDQDPDLPYYNFGGR